MNDEYVRKDLHDEQLKHLEDNTVIAFEGLEKRLNDTHSLVSWGIGILSFVFVIVQVAVAYFIFYMQSIPH